MLLEITSMKSHFWELQRWTDLLECQSHLLSYQIFGIPPKHFLEFFLIVQFVVCSVLMEYTKIVKLYPLQEGKIRAFYSGFKELSSLPMLHTYVYLSFNIKSV